ncbi:MAG: adenine nucleotide alpha hydrolase [Pseudomonadota bacterium]
MTAEQPDKSRGTTALRAVIREMLPVTVAVSGGVDSMTLASFSHCLGFAGQVNMIHAVSPAVPPQATDRVRKTANDQGWQLEIIDAGEFSDPRYRANPVNRCFFCKTNLYAALADRTSGTILSGTNHDDLGDYRPGLDAARNHSVRHPYVEAKMTKADVRGLAAELGLSDIAELPASPCLSSRIETGLAINPDELRLVNQVEQYLQTHLSPHTVRCRVRKAGFVIELDRATRSRLTTDHRTTLLSQLKQEFPELDVQPLTFAGYEQGSAFVGARPSINK